MDTSPTIDVIIPVYNGAPFIIDAIKSVEAQTYRPGRIIVIDDGSTDTTAEVVRNYQSSIPLLFLSQKNAGPNSARNAGLKETTAPFVAFLDADDMWLPHKLEQQIVVFLQSTPDLALVYGRYDSIDATGTIDTRAQLVPLDRVIRGSAFAPLLVGNKILGSASNVLIKKSVFDTVGLFDETLRMGEDWDMWLRIAEQYSVDYVDDILVHIRRHAGNQTSVQRKVLTGELAFYKKWVPRITDHYAIPKRWPDIIAFHALTSIKEGGSIALIEQALSVSTRKKLFSSTYGSVRLYVVLFVIRKVCSPCEWSKILAKIKRI